MFKWLERLLETREQRELDEKAKRQMIGRQITHGTFRNDKGEIIAERSFDPPHTNVWHALLDLKHPPK